LFVTLWLFDRLFVGNVRFLIDTNVLISSEPGRHDDVEVTTAQSLELARIAAGDHKLMVHPTISEEIANDRDCERRRLRELVRNRYPTLDRPPQIQTELTAELGEAQPGSHDWYDHLLLACVFGNAVHGLITQDDAIRRKARRFGIADRVFTVADAVAMLAQHSEQAPSFIPSVERRPLHGVDLADPFFDSLREDYPDFDLWFAEAARSGRDAFVVDGPAGQIAGLCILKGLDNEIGVGRRPAKMSTFKVADAFKGSRYGELLLKAIFRSVHGTFDALWLTVFPRHSELIAMLETFGFFRLDDHGGERRYVKELKTPAGAPGTMTPLEYHIKYGPPAVLVRAGQTFIIPIRPRFHSSLFPDAPGEQTTLLAPRPHGNALRKAYLCRANIRSMLPGATLLFYRSGDAHAVTTAGVLEETMKSDDAELLLEFVGTRTVYSAEEVRGMTKRGCVLALLFRQDRFLEPPIRLRELVGARAVSRAPQTTISINSEGIPWLTARLAA
jgi:rRNA-processing protein FCF1